MTTTRGAHMKDPVRRAAVMAARQEADAVRRYLSTIGTDARTARHATPEALGARYARLTDSLREEADPLKRLELEQARLDLAAAMAIAVPTTDLAEVEAAFIACAASWARRKGVTYAAFRTVGVPAATLKAAGIGRGLAAVPADEPEAEAEAEPEAPAAPITSRGKARGKAS